MTAKSTTQKSHISLQRAHELTQSITNLNAAMVSTIAKADDALKASATALRGVTEVETIIGDIHRRIDADSKTIGALINRVSQTERSISDEGQVRRNGEAITEQKIQTTRRTLDERVNTLHRQINAVHSALDERIDKLDSKLNEGPTDRQAWVALGNRLDTQQERMASIENKIASLSCPTPLEKAGIAITPPPDHIAFPIRFTAVVLFKGGTVAAKTGFPTVEGAMTWFKGYQARAAEHHRCEAKHYTCIVANEVE